MVGLFHRPILIHCDGLSYILLSVSQFTLLASTKKGNKPDFHGAAGGEEAKNLYQYFFEKVRQGYAADKVQNGVFQAMMEVALVNDGPVSVSMPSRWWVSTNDYFRSHWRSQLRQRLIQKQRRKLGRVLRRYPPR